MRSVKVPIQAGAKACEWCHFARRVPLLTIRGVEEFERRWCELFCRELEMGPRGPMRLDDCKDTESTERE